MREKWCRRSHCCTLLSCVYLAHRFHGIGVVDALVFTVALHPGEPQREAAGVTSAGLKIIECNFHHQLRADIYGTRVAVRFAREQLEGLLFEQRVGEPLEGFTEHDVLTGTWLKGTQV